MVILMNNIIAGTILIIFIVFLGIFVGYLMDNEGNINENDLKVLGINPEIKTEFTVSSEGPVNLDKLIADIKTNPYFEGYDNKTLIWMESLYQKDVFITKDGYVIMSKKDASNINTEYVTDAYIEEYIKCIMVENHSLSGNHSKNVYLVKNVENLGNKTYYLQGCD